MNFRTLASTVVVSLLLTGNVTAQAPKTAAPAAKATAPAAKAAPASHAKARKLLELTGADALGGQVVDSVIADIRRNVPQVPDTFWKTFRTTSKPAALADRLVSVYVKHFNEAELDELNRFYSSPLGRRFVANQPMLAKESMVVARAWAQQLAQSAMQQMAAKGYIQKAQKK